MSQNLNRTSGLPAELPALADNAPGVNGFKYKSKFGVIVVCGDEAEHKAIYERLRGQGYKCRLVRV